MVFGQNDKLIEYQSFLQNIRDENEIPVVIYSSQSEKVLIRNFGLEKFKHYDRYSSKLVPESFFNLKKTLDNLLRN